MSTCCLRRRYCGSAKLYACRTPSTRKEGKVDREIGGTNRGPWSQRAGRTCRCRTEEERACRRAWSESGKGVHLRRSGLVVSTALTINMFRKHLGKCCHRAWLLVFPKKKDENTVCSRSTIAQTDKFLEFFILTGSHPSVWFIINNVLPITLSNISSINVVFIFRCSSSTRNPVYTRRIDSSPLVFNLSSHRHSYIGLVCTSHFID